MSNPHIQNTFHTIGEANIPGLGWETADAQHIALQIEANTRATLALAYEQRTANLIAALDQVSPQDYAWLKDARDNPESDKGRQLARWDAIGRQIEERLNLA